MPQLSSKTEDMFNSLHSSTNQKLFEKHLCNRGSHYDEKHWQFHLHAKEAITCNHQINAFHCQQT